MHHIDGLDVSEGYLPAFEWVRDIQHYEGPLTAQYTNAAGEIYIFHWCDYSDELNRWIVVRVSRRALLELTSGLIPIYELLVNRNQDRNPLIIDIDDEAEIAGAKLVNIDDLPATYLPKPEALIDPYLFDDHETNVFPLLIDGDWDTHDLGAVQRRFYDLFSIHYTASSERVQFTTAPMRGGFSFVKFYSLLKSYLPDFSIPSMKAVHYASPGYIEFNAKRSVGIEIKRNVDRYIANYDDIYGSYKLTGDYIKQEDLNNENRPPLTDIQSQRLATLGRDMLSHFEDPNWDWVMANAGDEFRAAKIARSYCKRIEYFVKLINQDRVRFAEI